MNIREATLKAADHIEQNPEQFQYSAVTVPACGTKGCAAGWIAHFANAKEGESVTEEEVSQKLLGVPYWTFDERMDHLAPRWMRSATECAKGLRLYAEKYLTSEQVSS